MNDRFKFRFWNGKQMSDIIPFGCDLYDINAVMHAKMPIMQCTGLKDKNGTLIYEGDIVFYKINSIKCKDVVRWSDDSCGWVKGCQDLCTYKKHCEVVGNIYESKELLDE